ncbi:MAG TPA: amidophosphoribosyltransferase [Candidatus Binatia bacterium]|nr:amidophosphoribosyltransferase [Candidatus Binatia bacterium]
MGEIKEACGIFGVYSHPDAAYLTFLGLQALQHRGQESCGIVVSDGTVMRHRVRMGLVATNFAPEHFPGKNSNGEALYGYIASGHNRYSTTGSSRIENAQPLLLDIKYGPVSLAHNGNITNAEKLRNELKQRGADFKGTTDSEVIGKLIAFSSSPTLQGAIMDALPRLEGSYSLVITSNDALYAIRDPHGFRPLCFGYRDNAVIVASESCALDVVNATLNREMSPGEMIVVDKDSWQTEARYRSEWIVPKEITKPSLCLFELIYFARPDSIINGISVAEVRRKLGQQCAREHPVEADIVVPVLDSGLYAAQGYAKQSGIPLELAYVRNHYVHRTFINPSQQERAKQVNLKLNIIKTLVKGKRVVVVDDSIVRGNTASSRVAEFKACGAKEVHMRVSCPPTRHPCFYGVDFPTSKELIAANKTINQIQEHIRADSLGYVSMDGAIEAAKGVASGYCTACWTGKYPTALTDASQGLTVQKFYNN